MSEAFKSLGIERLSVQERLELIEDIWNSLPDTVTADQVPEWHLKEVSKRREYARSHPNEGTPWSDVRKELEALG